MKGGFAIVARDFWPDAAAIGDGLFQLACMNAQRGPSSVVSMSSRSDAELFEVSPDIGKLNYYRCKPLSDSSSSLMKRIFELFYFSLFVVTSLIRVRPAVVYCATNPPILVPFLVFLYAKIFGGKYIYHIQDMHPESASLVLDLPKFLTSIATSLDNIVLKNASVILTISDEMKASIADRQVVEREILTIENPALVTQVDHAAKMEGLVFCGNAGRLQLMDEVLSAVEKYYEQGGALKIAFVGGGVFKEKIRALDENQPNFSYFGKVSGKEALEITARYTWGLLPIEPRVLRFGFPSKVPTYLSAGCRLFCVTDVNSSLARWINEGDLGVVMMPIVGEIIRGFFDLEGQALGDRLPKERLFLSSEGFARKLDEYVVEVLEGTGL